MPAAVASTDDAVAPAGFACWTNCFQVLVGDREIAFAEVGRRTSETDPEAADARIERLVPVVLRRAMSTSTELFDWRVAIAAGKDDRRDVTIRQPRSTPGGSVVNAWRLVRAWPARWSGPAFNALRADVAMEEIELRFDDLVWLTRGRKLRGG